MKAMILAAGRGTRLGELGAATPKVLLEVGGRPLLARHLDQFAREGFTSVVVNAHHQADQVERFLTEYRGPVDVTVVRENRLLGTAGAVRNALDRLGPDPFVVLYGDVVADASFSELAALHRRAGASATLAVHRAASTDGKGAVVLDGHRVTAFVEKGPPDERGAWINSGIYVLDPHLVERLPAEVDLDFGQDVFPAAIGRGDDLRAQRLASPVIDIGTTEGLAAARALLGGRERSA